jgi:hypothetical protein
LEAPSEDDWYVAIETFKMVRDLDEKDFRARVQQLAIELEREGLRAHRAADRWEQRTAFPLEVTPADYVRPAILARLSEQGYTDRHWRIAQLCVGRLSDAGLEVDDALRQQAAMILDVSQILDDVLQWYERRHAALFKRDSGELANDTIATFMLEWNMKPTETARQLMKYGIAVTADALSEALRRQRKRKSALAGKEGVDIPGPWQVLRTTR